MCSACNSCMWVQRFLLPERIIGLAQPLLLSRSCLDCMNIFCADLHLQHPQSVESTCLCQQPCLAKDMMQSNSCFASCMSTLDQRMHAPMCMTPAKCTLSGGGGGGATPMHEAGGGTEGGTGPVRTIMHASSISACETPCVDACSLHCLLQLVTDVLNAFMLRKHL